ncbi:MAG: DnaA regulatory inactivator Hda [Betaproteobacteria bacterium]
MKQLAFEFSVPPQPAFDNFIPGRNAELLENLRRVALSREGERSIYIWGASGSGRSHLLHATVGAALSASATARYLSCAKEASLPDDLPSCECVAIDNVESLNETAQITLFNVCNAMREKDGAFIASGDVPPARLALRPDVVTRLAWGLVYEIHALSDEEKAQALQRRALERGFALAGEVCAYLLARAPREMSVLLAVVDAMDRYSLETKRPVSVALARELLLSAQQPQQPQQPQRAAEPGSAA